MIGLRPYAYRTSHRIDEVEVEAVGAAPRRMLLKDLRRSELHQRARDAKPAFLDDPRREIEAYHKLAGLGVGVPECFDWGEHWLLLEEIEGVELWQVGELDVWIEVARWLGRFHARFTGRPPAADHLLTYDAAYFKLWPERARRLHPRLAGVAHRYSRVVDVLCGLPPTFVHGEFYPSNVMVAGHRIAPVDWEMAGVGPGIIDLAALVTGWGESERAAIVAGYGPVDPEVLDMAGLHIAMQWLGWSSDWTPPDEHAHDWLADALDIARRIGL